MTKFERFLIERGFLLLETTPGSDRYVRVIATSAGNGQVALCQTHEPGVVGSGDTGALITAWRTGQDDYQAGRVYALSDERFDPLRDEFISVMIAPPVFCAESISAGANPLIPSTWELATVEDKANAETIYRARALLAPQG